MTSDCPKINLDDIDDDLTMERMEASLMSRKRSLDEDEKSSVSDEISKKQMNIKGNEYYNSIVLSMKAECAMLSTSAQEEYLLSQKRLMPSQNELQAIYGRYASTIKIKGNPFLYCQVCMYKTNAEDDFRIHFLSNEHWQTVAKMEQPSNQKLIQTSDKMISVQQQPGLNLPGICSLINKKSHPSAGIKKTTSGAADSGSDTAESTCRPVLLSSLDQLDHIFSGIAAAESVSIQNPTSDGKTEERLNTEIDLRQNIIRRHLEGILEEHPDGQLSYNSLLEEIISYVDDGCDVIDLGIICDDVIKELFPSAHVVHIGSSQDLFYCGVQLKHRATETKKTPRDIGLTGEIFDILSDLIRYTGNMADSVPRSELLNMLSRRFNQPQILYWGPQCNKAIEALYPNIDIRRKGRSKVTYYYGVCLNTDQTPNGHSPEMNGHSPETNGHSPEIKH